MKILGYSPQGVYTLNEDTGAITSTFEEPLERGEEKAIRFSLASRHLRWLQGEILTIIDATLSDERKLRAVKDLVRDKFAAKISWLYEQCGAPESEQSELPSPDGDVVLPAGEIKIANGNTRSINVEATPTI